MPLPNITVQFGCHAHLKVLLEVPHPNPNIFSLNLNELDNGSWRGEGQGYQNIREPRESQGLPFLIWGNQGKGDMF